MSNVIVLAGSERKSVLEAPVCERLCYTSQARRGGPATAEEEEGAVGLGVGAGREAGRRAGRGESSSVSIRGRETARVEAGSR